ncbi:MAG: DAK2 domain-containing protein, partial [Anaerolineae bacterium]
MARTTTVAATRPTEGVISTVAATSGVDGAGFHELLRAGLEWLDAHHGIVNALNVFPVPDGDTGTNMLLTMKSALQEIANTAATTLGQVARAAAHGALMGA